MTPIERAARALAGFNHRWEALDEDGRQTYYDRARAVIEAIRKPNDAMLDACGSGYCRKWAPAAWDQMIGVVLDDTPA